jgi:hypothetical protein
LFATAPGAAIGIAHDVKNSNMSENGAASENFQLMTPIACRTENPVGFCYHAMLNDLQNWLVVHQGLH